MDKMIQLQRGARKILATGLAAIAFGVASVSALAGSPEQLRITVSYAELDLTKPAGAEVLYRRIKNAAFIVCRGEASIMPQHNSVTQSACYKAAVDNAVLHVNAPLLTNLHRGQPIRLARQ